MPLLVIYRAVANVQLLPSEIAVVLSHLRDARRLLVFGLGRDWKLWEALGPPETHFLEHEPDRIEAAGSGARHVHRVSYSSRAEDGWNAAGDPVDLGLPQAVKEVDWDVVVVDGPPGSARGTPGRSQSLRAAAGLVRPGGTVVVHDLDRELEQRVSSRWLGTPMRCVGRSGVFRALWKEAPPFERAQPPGPPAFRRNLRPFMDPERVSRWYRDEHIEISVVNFEEGLRFGPRHEREVVLVRDPWYPTSVGRSVLLDKMRNRSGRGRVIYLSNTEEMHRMRRRLGLDSHFVNMGAFVDETKFVPIDADKRYDAAMISRFSWLNGDQLKRHHLAAKVESLALLDPIHGSESAFYRGHYAARPNCHFINDCRLQPAQVARVLAQSHCGLILSPLEGACRASSEYLLCGLPVVSTRSRGGRDVWYDDENSIIVEPDPDAVAEAVVSLVGARRDPVQIRARYLQRAAVFRERLIEDVLEPVMLRFGATRTARDLVASVPFPWWPNESERPESSAATPGAQPTAHRR